MSRTESWELLGLFLTAGASLSGLAVVFPSVGAVTTPFGGIVLLGRPEASVGAAGLALTVLGSAALIILGQLRPPGGNPGASLIVWTDFAVLVVGDALFYSRQLQPPVILLVGLASAVLTGFTLFVVGARPFGLPAL